MEITTTDRGFPYASFEDFYEKKCSIQISSLADERCIWLGIEYSTPKVMTKDAIDMGIETYGKTTGWVDYPIDPRILFSTRMHLSMDQVKELLPILINFAETGELCQ